MRTMADAMAADERRKNKPQPIYGDPNLGYYEGDFGSGEPDFVHHAHIQEWWSADYWREYEMLRERARKSTGAISLNMVVLIDGNYRVSAMLPDRGRVYGPPTYCRNVAWVKFETAFTPIPVLPRTTMAEPDVNTAIKRSKKARKS